MNDDITSRDDGREGSQDAGPRGSARRRCARTGMGRRARLGLAGACLIGLGAALGGLAAVSGTAGAHLFRGYHEECAADCVTGRALERTAWVLGRVDATPAQEEQINALVEALVEELAPLGEAHRAHRRAFLTELRRDDVDRGALERLRQEELRLADLASARVADALVDASRILTPEQREELLGRLDRRGPSH